MSFTEPRWIFVQNHFQHVSRHLLRHNIEIVYLVKERIKAHNARVVNIVQKCYFILEHARLTLELLDVLEARFVDDFDSNCLLVGSTDSSVDLTELTRAKKLIRIDVIFFFQILFFQSIN